MIASISERRSARSSSASRSRAAAVFISSADGSPRVTRSHHSRRSSRIATVSGQ
jgi:hypothetical protein